jgi:hypothetical protein
LPKGLPNQVSFFKYPVFQSKFRNQLLELIIFPFQVSHFFAVSFSCGIAGQALLASFEKLLAPAVVQIAVDPFPPAQFGDRCFSTESFKDYADLIFSGIFLASLSADVSYCFFD